MKIRQGFVSNSSSTSFCIYGAWMNPLEDVDNCKWREDLDEHLYVYHGDGWNTTAVGLSSNEIEDNETGEEFKQRVKDLIKKHTGQDVKCEWIEETYY